MKPHCNEVKQQGQGPNVHSYLKPSTSFLIQGKTNKLRHINAFSFLRTCENFLTAYF